MRLPSPSMAVSATALFVALSGTSYAVTQIDRNSVGSAQIKSSAVGSSEIRSNAVRSSEIRSSAVGSSEVRNRSLRAGDFAAGQLPAGPRGANGAKGDKGDQGDANTRWVLVNRAGTIEAASDTRFRIANAYPAGSAGEGNVYIDSGDANLSNNGIVTSIALENAYSLKGAPVTPAPVPPLGTLTNGRNPEADNNPEFSGEITATKCAITGVVTCAPPDTVANGGPGTAMSTNTNRHFVVSPRNSDGTVTVNDDSTIDGDQSTHKRFYVIITGPNG